MAALPKCRVATGFRAFSCKGVDYFGPILVKVGRKHAKRYGCLFTCMASRAVNIEVVYSLNASSFLQAFFRFIHRRGTVRDVFSGGAWEILTKTVKKIMHSLAGERSLDDEALHSLLVEVEGIMNNRPLTPVSDHPKA